MTAPRKGSARAFRAEADYSDRGLTVAPGQRARIRELLVTLYGEDRAPELTEEVVRLLRVHDAHKLPEARTREASAQSAERFSEQDVILITYGDLIVSDDLTPLQTLARVADDYLRGLVSIVHLLPFFPWSSDRGSCGPASGPPSTSSREGRSGAGPAGSASSPDPCSPANGPRAPSSASC